MLAIGYDINEVSVWYTIGTQRYIAVRTTNRSTTITVTTIQSHRIKAMASACSPKQEPRLSRYIQQAIKRRDVRPSHTAD